MRELEKIISGRESEFENKKIIFIRPIMSISRYHYLRTIELSKYYNISWLVGYYLNEKDEELHIGNNHHNVTIIDRKRSKSTNPIINNWVLFTFYFKAIKFLRENKADLVIVHNNRYCFLLPLFCFKAKYVLQLSTATVSSNKFRRFFGDFIGIKFNILFYRRFNVATSWMINKFNLNKEKTIITRWGSPLISIKRKVFNELKLFYIGSLTNRNVHETVIGLGLFISRFGRNMKITYDIVGNGKTLYIDLINKAIQDYSLTDIVKVHGYIEDKKIKYFFDNCNIGVSYVPVTPYYNDVVATKTEEYLLAGMAVIATNTNENAKVVNEEVGVLINDDPESFCNGLLNIEKNLSKYSSEKIFLISEYLSLEYTVKNNVVPAYNSIL